ncbi:pentapeptide repeat-containing protein [Phormidesmis sp. 146-35]
MKLKIATSALLVTIGLTLPAKAENLEHTRQLLSTKQCQRCNLSGAGLTFAQLMGANLSQANLSGANLSQSNLAGVNLSGANLSGASLSGANLTGANLNGANLTGADLRGAFLSGADMTGAQIEGAALQGAIGLAPTLGNADDFYRWALEAAKQRNFGRAIENYNQTILRKPDHAMAYFGRGVARMELGDQAGAIQDSEQASTLFASQGNKTEAESAKKMAETLKNPPKEKREPSGGGFGQALISVVGGLLQLFLFR